MNSEMGADDSAADKKHYSIPYSLDPEQFFRRRCSSCDREFKVSADAISLADILSPAFKQIEVDIPLLLQPYTWIDVKNELEGLYKLLRALLNELGPVRWEARVI